VGFGKEKNRQGHRDQRRHFTARTLADARLAAEVTVRNFGYAGQKVKLSVRDGAKVLATQEVALKAEGAPQTSSFSSTPGWPARRVISSRSSRWPGKRNR